MRMSLHFRKLIRFMHAAIVMFFDQIGRTLFSFWYGANAVEDQSMLGIFLITSIITLIPLVWFVVTVATNNPYSYDIEYYSHVGVGSIETSK